MDVVRMPRRRARGRSDQWLDSLVWEIGLWSAEAFIGVIPLLADAIGHMFLARGTHLVVCRWDIGAGAYAGCAAHVDGPDAEKCILTVVLSGLALLTAIVRWVQPRGSLRILSRIFAMLGLLALFLVGALMYAFIASGTNQNTAGYVDWLIASTLLTSLFLTIDREI